LSEAAKRGERKLREKENIVGLREKRKKKILK